MRHFRFHAVAAVALVLFTSSWARAQDAKAVSPPTQPPAGTGAASSAPAPAPSTRADTPTAPGNSGAPVGSASAGTAEEARAVRLRTLEQRVQALKEQSWRVKARVGLLKEAVLGGGIGARASIVHENKMGDSFRLIKLVYALDGNQIFARADDTGKLHDLKTIDILSGPIAPGNHTLSVLMLYRGHGYDVFKYLKNYKFTVRSSHVFSASEGKHTKITVVGYEKGGVTTPLEQRPSVEFKVNVVTERAANAGK